METVSKIVGFGLVAFLGDGLLTQCEKGGQADKAQALYEQQFRHDLCNRNGVPVSRCNYADTPPETWQKWLDADMREFDRKLGIKP